LKNYILFILIYLPLLGFGQDWSAVNAKSMELHSHSKIDGRILSELDEFWRYEVGVYSGAKES